MTQHFPRGPLDIQTPLTRRNLLQSLGVAGGAGLLAACGGGQPAAAQADQLELNLQDPSESLLHFTRIFGDTVPENVTVGWFGGTVYSVVGDSSQVQPLLGLEGIGIMRVQPLEDNKFRVFNRELAFYKDLRTGAYLDEWVNPLNGKLVETFPMHNMTVNAETAPIFEMDIEGTQLRVPFPATWQIVGDNVFSNFEIHLSVPSELQPNEWPIESPGPLTRITEIFQRNVRMSDLRNPELTSIPYTGTWKRLSSWYPWMLMGQADGHLAFSASTAKLNSMDEVPAAFLEKASKDHSAYLEPPTLDSWGQPNDSTFNMYKRERTPLSADS